MTECPDDNTIAEFAGGEIAAEKATYVEAHLAECAACRRLLGGTIELSSHVRGSRGSDGDAGTDLAARRERRIEGLALAPADPDRYVVGRELFRGGMGRIVEAWDVR